MPAGGAAQFSDETSTSMDLFSPLLGIMGCIGIEENARISVQDVQKNPSQIKSSSKKNLKITIMKSKATFSISLLPDFG